MSAALAAAEDIDVQLEKAKKALLHQVTRSLDPTYQPPQGLCERLGEEVQALTAQSRRKRDDLQALQQLRERMDRLAREARQDDR